MRCGCYRFSGAESHAQIARRRHTFQCFRCFASSNKSTRPRRVSTDRQKRLILVWLFFQRFFPHSLPLFIPLTTFSPLTDSRGGAWKDYAEKKGNLRTIATTKRKKTAQEKKRVLLSTSKWTWTFHKSGELTRFGSNVRCVSRRNEIQFSETSWKK